MSIKLHVLDLANQAWSPAVKSKLIRSKAAKSCVDSELLPALLMYFRAEHGYSQLDDVHICLGQAKPWTCKFSRLQAEYDPIPSSGGWTCWVPKPQQPIEFFVVKREHVEHIPAYHDQKTGAGFIVSTSKGLEIDGVKNLHPFNVGDVIARKPLRPEQPWVLKRELFDNLYEPRP